MTTVREGIILAACRLLEKQGYPATGLSEIVKESGSPKGSLYYYFPGGKEQIVSEAVLFAGNILVERMRDELSKYDNPIQALYEYIMKLAGKVEEKNFFASNPLTIVAVEAAGTSERISQACQDVYAQIQEVLQEKMVCCGLSETEAARQATLTLASLEGSIILSRVYRTSDPLRTLAEHLKDSLPQSKTSLTPQAEDDR
jgi:TetR/AcrR family transcriptional regulator, lmrAB and yxaGH operons repressor